MNLDETAGEPATRVDLANALRGLGHAVVAHRLDPGTAAQIAAVARQLTDSVVALPRRDRSGAIADDRRLMGAFAGQPSPLVADGEVMDLFGDSIVSGGSNPMGIGLEVRRHGDTAVATTTLGPAFEGAPGRAHGGVIAAILDETMGHVLAIVGEVAYTAHLSIDYTAPAPVLTELTFTAGLRNKANRKLWIEATGHTGDGLFVRAEALFLTVSLELFSNRPVIECVETPGRPASPEGDS